MSEQLIISIITDDKPGVVEQIAAIVTRNNGNWLESALSRLGGKFAGILLVEIAKEGIPSLKSELEKLSSSGIRVAVESAGNYPINDGTRACFEVVGNDRQGIVGEISSTLARHNVSVDELFTRIENAPMSGELLFKAKAKVIIPKGLDHEDLIEILEELSNDLIVEFTQL